MSTSKQWKQRFRLAAVLLPGLFLLLLSACGTETTISSPPSEANLSTIVPEPTTQETERQVIRFFSEPKMFLLDPATAADLSEAVVVGRVIKELPIRQNPRASEPWEPVEGVEPPAPVLYKGYVIEVERGYGNVPVGREIIAYTMGNGEWVHDGVTASVEVEFPCDLSVGDQIIAPIIKDNYFDTPELKEDEYWFTASFAVFRIKDGVAERVTQSIYGAAESVNAQDHYQLSDLEVVARSTKGSTEIR